ncbi:Aste57867_15792 [Aphanomyces stellatus]|uniref:Aste57867_15792 protein n=1 Tax=Aphanomyces stellatus TaxID=120398 RepID=A0A485L500_9STRA|nr:hypothetical protein As57867_015736 [Aphanomyces stellatus]VFT92580.1 Aste57867_15792 [Aphanomyces stellatus]
MAAAATTAATTAAMAAKKAATAVGSRVVGQMRSAIYVFKEVSWQAALDEVLQANQEPDNSYMTVMTAARLAKERAYIQSQFQKCQEQVSMDPNLLFFAEPYEAQYAAFMNAVNLFRVRLTFSMGAAATAFYFWYEASILHAYDPSNLITPVRCIALYGLTFGVIVPTFALGVLASFVPAARTRLESVAAIVYAVVALALISKKCVQKAPGAIFPLVILLIPLFNVTRMRFAVTCVVGWSIVGIFFVVQLAAGPDPTSRTVFTTLNYSMSIISGMISSYQKELFKRRNFTLGINFSGVSEDASSRIHSPYYKKEALCHPWTQAFKHADLERRFHRYWYLLDGSPYENPNAGILHRGVYLGLRYPLAGICLNQVVLVLQDVINLYGTDEQLIALAIRFCGIVPAYIGLVYAFYKLSHRFAAKWLALRSNHVRPEAVVPAAATTPDDTRHPPHVALTKSVTRIAVHSKSLVQTHATHVVRSMDRDFVGTDHGYTHTIQLLTALVLLIHVYLTGTLVYVIAINLGVKDVYFMGLLNAMMVAHRSSFRLRFVYSSTITVAASIGFLFGTRHVLPKRTLGEYMVYLAIVQVLGMIVSYEEENLRRSFFIKKSLRSLEFQAWLSRIVQLPVWIRETLRRKAREARHRLGMRTIAAIPITAGRPMTLFMDPLAELDLHKNLRGLQSRLNKGNKVVTNASARISQAGRLGVYATVVSVLIALGQVIFFLTHLPK